LYTTIGDVRFRRFPRIVIVVDDDEQSGNRECRYSQQKNSRAVRTFRAELSG